MRTILYIEGLGFDANAANIAYLKERFPTDRIELVTLEYSPAATLKKIQKTVKEVKPKLIIASDLGAFYAMAFPKIKKLLVNPTFDPYEDISRLFHTNFEKFGAMALNQKTEQYGFDENWYKEIKELKDKLFEVELQKKEFSFWPYRTYVMLSKDGNWFELDYQVQMKLPQKNMTVCEGGHIYKNIPYLIRKIQEVYSEPNRNGPRK